MNYQFRGKHILAEFYGVSNIRSTKTDVEFCLKKCCECAGVTMLEFGFVEFPNGAYTAYALLKESHISIHTYPEYQSIFLDVFTCGKSDTYTIVDLLSDFYMPSDKKVHVVERGRP